MDLIFASTNQNKLEEVKDILKDNKIISLRELNDFDEVDENGSSFKENAYLKANHTYQKYKKATFADDSGLIVESLNGAPGIRSARYSGSNSNYHKNNLKLLRELEGIDNRRAYFITVICFIDNDGQVSYFEGRIYGEITHELKGTEGFGYDPIFYLPEYEKTFAELGSIKNKLSHRARALKSFNEFLNKEV